MKVFEFHFNPKLKPDLLFDSFYYEAENLYEKKLGSLYLVGILKNALPQNARFLNNLVKTIKDEYYRLTLKNPEKALKESLKEANEFLEQMVKRGDVRWLGNLSFAVLSLKNFELNFTKVGDLKIFLLRNGKVIDIDRKLNYEDIVPWPLRIFGNIVEGKLAENDVLLISTKEVTGFFEKENLLAKIAQIPSPSEKELKDLFDEKKEEVLKICGACLIVVLTKEVLAGKKEVITPKSYPKEFNLKQVFTPFLNSFKKIKLPALPKMALPKMKKVELKRPAVSLPQIPKIDFLKLYLKLKSNKRLVLICSLLFFLLLGFFIAQTEEKQKLKSYQNNLDMIKEKITQAESFLILGRVKLEAINDANTLFKESWQELSPLVKEAPFLPETIANDIYSLKNKVSENLYQLNQLTEVSEPELVFEFNSKEFVPQKMTVLNKNLYLFSPYSENLFELNRNGEGKLIQKDKKINLAVNLEDFVVFFSRPNQLTVLKDGSLFDVLLNEPPFTSNFSELASFRDNLYFLDKNSGEIIRYQYRENLVWGDPQYWLAGNEKATDAKSVAVDGAGWILNKDNSIGRYYGGKLEKIIKLNIFPIAEDFSKIYTSVNLSYLFILEPGQQRIIVSDKTGKILKQFQSQKFDNLLDFAVSEDGKTIYLLNGLKVFLISV